MSNNPSLQSTKAHHNGKLIFKGLRLKTLSKINAIVVRDDIYSIDISDNNLISVPEAVSEFQCLEILNCSHNSIRSLPNSFSNLIFLERLDISCNNLTSLPALVCKLEHLRILLVSSNRLVSLPQALGSMVALEELDASCNCLTCLPEEVAGLSCLRILNLRHNKLLDLPAKLHQLPLEYLDLSENQLISVPTEVHLMETLQTLNLDSNPLNFPPINICNRGLVHVMKWLRTEQQRAFHTNRITAAVRVSVAGSKPQQAGSNNNYNTLPLPLPDTCKSATATAAAAAGGELMSEPAFSRHDSGYHTVTESCQPQPPPPLAQQQEQQQNQELEQQALDAGHYRKNKQPPSQQPPLHQPPSHQPLLQPISPRRRFRTSPRRISMPDTARALSSSSNHDVDVTSHCVVVVDSSPQSDGPSPELSTATASATTNGGSVLQSNNSSSAQLSSLRGPRSPSQTSRVSFDLRRDNTTRSSTNSVSSDQQSRDMNREIQEKIRKLHKIIEAQLHVQIPARTLCEELSSGVYLCHLANILAPHCVPTVHTPSPGQTGLGRHKCRRNLENFVEACRRHGVPERCLFSIKDALNCNPSCLLFMADSVEGLISAIRSRKTNPGLTSPSSARADWHSILENPHATLSNRARSHRSCRANKIPSNTSTTSTTSAPSSQHPQLFSQMSGGSSTVYRQRKSVSSMPQSHQNIIADQPPSTSTIIKRSKQQIIHFSSEV